MINIRPEVAGYYKMEAVNAKTGKKRLLADWFPNIITDTGLNSMGSPGDGLAAFSVGSGSTAPATTDSSLASHVAITVTTEAQTRGTSPEPPYYGFRRVTRRFDEGVAAGNLSEVGVGFFSGSGASLAPGPLFSRALILDGLGEPTTITVLSDEFLDVTYELRMYAPAEDVVETVTDPETGVVYTVTTRPAFVTTTGSQGHYWGSTAYGTEIIPYRGGQVPIGFSSGPFRYPKAYSGDIGLVTDGPSGVLYAENMDFSRVIDAYSNNSLERSGHHQLHLSEGNEYPMRSLLHSFTGGGMWQTQFDPAIAKTDTDILTIGVKVAWARHDP